MGGGGALQVVIMAGGVDMSLWPLSRRKRPKQFQPLFSGRTMLGDTYARVRLLAPADSIWVVTSTEFCEITRSLLPEVPPQNIIGEPMERGTAVALALAVTCIERQQPDPIVLATPVDSYIGDASAYCDCVNAASVTAQRAPLVILGAVPSYANTAYGYIKRGKELKGVRGAYRVEGFTEKPSRETAERFVAEGGYAWNMGHFVFRADRFAAVCARHVPAIAKGMCKLRDASDVTSETVAEVYRDLPTVSLERGLAEREKTMAMIPTVLEWRDIGSWRVVQEIVARHGDMSPLPEQHIGAESRRCFVVTGFGRLVVTAGVDDLVVIDTEDALLIMRQGKAEHVQDVVRELLRRGKEEYL